MTTEDGHSTDELSWRWVADARLAAMRMQALPEETRREAVTIARTTMLTLTAYTTPIGWSPISQARQLAQELAEPYSDLEATPFHCAALLFFFDLIDSKYYHDLGLPWEFWHFGDLMMDGIGFHHRPRFSMERPDADGSEAQAWLIERANRVRRALETVAGHPSRITKGSESDVW
ncbi:hypothetical protein AKG07_13695 [Microbacterium sp. CGR1]|uniref:hypothetical protein n=1 Tax=Microbacterium sp. CGR1 TaxID=1696072 RepID=UPI00069CD3BE|nr:hypothetical protein [Microbacterium sp. CGR1]AKV87171.1 hypothetical protein AKG07_13695 [Microbacterium sp. CGR1]